MKKPVVVALVCLGAVAVVAAGVWLLSPRDRPPNGTDKPPGKESKELAEREKEILTKEQAIAAARMAWGKEVPEGTPIDVTLNPDRTEYTVVFKTNFPPGTRGADYHAKVVLEATTGKVKQLLVGS